MKFYWERNIAPKRLLVAECDSCRERVVALMRGVLINDIFALGVHCSKCLTMLNLKQNIEVAALAENDLYMATGCRPVHHPTRYNPKYNFGVSNWLSVRWRQF